MMRRRDCLLTACHCSLWALPAMAAAPKAPLILVVGDSISAEYGLARGQGWVALLAQRLTEKKLTQQVQNASISGDTTSGGLARLPALLQQYRPTVVIIELGGNDALRGLPLANSRANLKAMVQASKSAGAKVLLLGMQVPPNYGASYQREFSAMFEQVAREERTRLVPFLLKGIGDQADAQAWFQPDRIHPLARAHPLMLELVWQGLKPLL
jgi:acyl-CoA thioesterase I